MRSKQEILTRMNEVGIVTRACGGICPMVRTETISIDIEKRTIPFILVSEQNAGERYDWWDDEVYVEELDVNGANFEALRTFFVDHNPNVENAIGRIENTRKSDGRIVADVVFGKDQKSDLVFQKYVDRILTDVSIGYRVKDIQVTEKKGEPAHVLVTDFEIIELSAVWKGFDKGATIGRETKKSSSVFRKRLNLLKRKAL